VARVLLCARVFGGAVPPFFAGLLPEGVRLGVVTSSTKTSADDHFTWLLANGAGTFGNVRVVPAGAIHATQAIVDVSAESFALIANKPQCVANHQ
jgi:hypothetical protein